MADNKELLPLPETNYNGYGDGSLPLYTEEMVIDYAKAYAANQAADAVPVALETPADEWDAYARRSGLLNESGVAPDPAKTQTAYFAFCAAWNRSFEFNRVFMFAAQVAASKPAGPIACPRGCLGPEQGGSGCEAVYGECAMDCKPAAESGGADPHTVIARLPDIFQQIAAAHIAGRKQPAETGMQYAKRVMEAWDLPDAPPAQAPALPATGEAELTKSQIEALSQIVCDPATKQAIIAALKGA